MSDLTSTQAPAHILVVDDEPEIAESLADFLMRKLYTVSTADSGPAACRFLETATRPPHTPVDLVLLDMRMPNMSGLAVLQWLRQHTDADLRYTRVIMLTAATGNREKVEALTAGADDYITKPYHPQELLARVHTLLRTQQLEKQLQQQRQQLADLNRASNEIAATLDLRRVFAHTAAGICTVLATPIAAVFMKSLSKNSLICQHISGGHLTADQYPAIPYGRGIIGHTLEQPRFFLVNDFTAEPTYDAQFDSAADETIHALLTVPIIVRGNTWGVLATFHTGPTIFNDFDLDLLASLSAAISSAIENAWLVQNLQARQQELLDNRNTLQAMMDGILQPIYTINQNWQLLSINQHKRDELKASADELIGRACYSALFERETPCEHCMVAQVLAEKQPQTWSVRWRGADHLPREWDINAYPVPSRHTAPHTSAVVVWQDRTEERKLEQSLLQAGKLAAIGQLAAGVAHEINNPLTAINANAEMLKMFIPPTDENYQSVDLIHRAGVRAAKVVGGLLDFAREQQYTFIPLDINRLIEQALELVTYQLNVAHVTTHTHLAPQLPRVAGSAEHLKSVWINLLINARDAMHEAGTEQPIIDITTRLSPTADAIHVIIRDNGPGVAEPAAVHIFEPFYTTKAPGKGTGLGLATCQRIIQQHGGHIELSSGRGQGATFVVELPLKFTKNKKNHLILGN